MKISFLKIAISRISIIALSALMTLSFNGCSNNTKPEDPKEVANDHNEAKFDKAKETDAQFLVNAAEINLEEIQLGQLAQNLGSMVHVKELGKMMETGHIKALRELQALAGRKQVTLPASLTESGQAAFKKLADKTGADFDKAYNDMMVEGHKAAISKFEKESTDATDPGIRAWAASMLTPLRTHLDSAITCQKECQKM